MGDTGNSNIEQTDQVRPPRTPLRQRFQTFLRLWVDPWFLGSLVVALGLHVVVVLLALAVPPSHNLSSSRFETSGGLHRLASFKLSKPERKLDIPRWLKRPGAEGKGGTTICCNVGSKACLTLPEHSPARTDAGDAPRHRIGEAPGQAPVHGHGVLTAASVGDADRFDNYLSYLDRHAREQRLLGLSMSRRVRIRVVDGKSRPVNDARVQLGAGGRIVAEGRTHADGIWDFYPDASGVGFVDAPLRLHVGSGQRVAKRMLRLPDSGEAPEQLIRLKSHVATPPPALDLAFLVDVTGSMGDEMAYLSREVAQIVKRIKRKVSKTQVRLGATFYRDRFDQERLRRLPFTTNVPGFARNVSRIKATGGGDYPEDMNAGLKLAMKGLRWRRGNVVRVLVLIGDAPPKRYADARYRYPEAMRDAARRGIRILPVAASGADRTVEFLFRALGAYTSTPYVYLTDDSGVGVPHMEADTDSVGVERFKDLLVRMVVEDLQGRGMHEPGELGPPRGQDRASRSVPASGPT